MIKISNVNKVINDYINGLKSRPICEFCILKQEEYNKRSKEYDQKHRAKCCQHWGRKHELFD